MTLKPPPPGPGQSRETWARGIVSRPDAHHLDLFPEEETKGQSDPQACAHARSCQMLLICILLICHIIYFTAVTDRECGSERGSHPCLQTPVPHPSHRATCALHSGLRGQCAPSEDFSRVRILCCSQVQTRSGHGDTGGDAHSRGFTCWVLSVLAS